MSQKERKKEESTTDRRKTRRSNVDARREKAKNAIAKGRNY